MSEKISDPKLKKELQRFANIIPEDVLNKFFQKHNLTNLDEVIGPAVAIMVDNSEVVAYLIKAISSAFKRKLGIDIEEKTKVASDFFFWLNEGVVRLEKTNKPLYYLTLFLLFGFDPVGASVSAVANFASKMVYRKKAIRAIADAFRITPPQSVAVDTSKAPPPPKQIKGPRSDIYDLSDSEIQSLDEQLKRMQQLAGIKKKVL